MITVKVKVTLSPTFGVALSTDLTIDTSATAVGVILINALSSSSLFPSV